MFGNDRAEIKDRGDVVRLLFGTRTISDAASSPGGTIPVMRALGPALPFPACGMDQLG